MHVNHNCHRIWYHGIACPYRLSYLSDCIIDQRHVPGIPFQNRKLRFFICILLTEYITKWYKDVVCTIFGHESHTLHIHPMKNFYNQMNELNYG